MRSILSAIALTAASLVAPSAFAEDAAYAQAEASETRLAVVLSYADWCGSCRVIDPKLEAIRTDNAFDGVQFVRLDYTERSDEAYFAAADAAGVGEAVRAKFDDQIKTGLVLLIDLDDASITSELRRDHTEAQMIEAIESAAAEA
ncbi:MAG: thioredoxin family protein [Pseudomonadota bacterium]